MTTRARLPEVAFFCTFRHRGGESAFAEMQNIVGKAPRTCCAVKAEAVKSGAYGPHLAEFVKSLGRASVIDQTETIGVNQRAPKRPRTQDSM